MSDQNTLKMVSQVGMLTGADTLVEDKKRVKTITLPVRGMSCASCVTKVERGLDTAEGVADATVNLATERATITYNPDEISPAVLIDTIKDLGYESGFAAAAMGMSSVTVVSNALRLRHFKKPTIR